MDFTKEFASAFANTPDLSLAAEEKARREQEHRDNPSSGKSRDFQPFVGLMSVKNPEEIVRFLHVDPVVCYMHDILDNTSKPPYKNGICFRDKTKCPSCLCDAGSEPKWKCAWLIVHLNSSYKSKKTSEVITAPQIKILMKGENFAGPMRDKIEQLKLYKLSLTGLNFRMKQNGSGFSTSYTFLEVPGSEGFSLPATLPRMYPESAGKSVEDDRALANAVFSDPQQARGYLQKLLVEMLPADDRFRLATRIAQDTGGVAPTAPKGEEVPF